MKILGSVSSLLCVWNLEIVYSQTQLCQVGLFNGQIKEKDGEQASTQLWNHMPAEHTSTIALLL